MDCAQLANTDVAIYTIGDPMLLWRKEYPAPHGSPWLHPVVPLDNGSIFVWPTGPGTDDWRFKHGVYWPRSTDSSFTGPPAGQRRLAFVFRCTRPCSWYQSAWPHRVCVPCCV